MKTIILASASPRRKALLKQIGLKFKVEPSDYVEELTLEKEPRELAKFLSVEKAKSVTAKHKNAIVIAADTIVVLQSEILGKAHTESEALAMLQRLNGKKHSVITAFTIIDSDTKKTVTKAIETNVYFKKLTEQETTNYVKTGEPLGKAGAYAIQGLGAVLVERIEGDYFNVVGLPLCALVESLKRFGVSVI